MAWLQDLIEKILSFVPRVHKLEPFQAGIRTTWGRYIGELYPGVYFYWPLIQTIWWVSTAPQVVDLKNQSCRTIDGHDIVISGAVQYKVVSARKHILNVHDSEKSLTTLALGVLCEYFNTRTLEQCKEIIVIKKELKKALNNAAAGWGVRIEEVFVTDLGKVRNIRLLTDGSSLIQTNSGVFTD